MNLDRAIRRSLALCCGLAFGPVAVAQDPKPVTSTPAAAKAGKPVAATDPLAVAILNAHNKLRAEAELPPLAFAPLLAEAALIQAADMAEHDEMKHEGSDGSTPADRVKRVGYRFLTTGENVAVTYPNVTQVMKAWFESPPHKKNILGDFTDLGVARVADADGKAYWCVEFGKPMPKFAAPDATADFVARLNDARAEAKHPKLNVDIKLTAAAQAQAVESAKASGKGGAPATFEGLDTNQYNELAMSTAVGVPTAEAVLKMFLENDQYKDKLYGSSTRVGVGYATDAEGTPYWCLILGKPVSSRR